jgi:small-conductance mechanosensitive channel
MSVAGVPLRSLAFFAGALGIGIGFGLQNIINNFVSGIILMFERPVRVGDIVILSPELGGTVDRIGPRSTTIVTPDNIAVVVPNAKLMDSQIVNWSQPTKMMRVHIFVGVAYGSDLELVKQCLIEVARKHHLVRKYPEPMVRFEKFGDSSLNFELIYWVDGPYERWITLSELNFAIDEAFRQNNIIIPFPQRDLHIRTAPPSTYEVSKEMRELKVNP